MVESIRHRKLTVAGACAGGLIGFFVFVGAGWTGLFLLAAFFLLGTAATAWKRQQKAQIGMAQERGGQRTLGQVFANGGVAGVLGLLALFFPQEKDLLAAMIAAVFSSALADTLSSELGSLYGRRFFNILTLKQEKRGLDGVVSLEGTAIGVLGSLLVALIYGAGYGWDQRVFWIVIAGTAGNLVDSILGATLERKGIINNDLVNVSNTLLAALLVWWLL